MVEQVVVDVAPPYEDPRGRGGLAHLNLFVQEHHGLLGQESILQQYRKPSCEAWDPVRQRQEDQDLA